MAVKTTDQNNCFAILLPKVRINRQLIVTPPVNSKLCGVEWQTFGLNSCFNAESGNLEGEYLYANADQVIGPPMFTGKTLSRIFVSYNSDYLLPDFAVILLIIAYVALNC